MTRFLSQALGAPEPGFSQSIQQLERAAGAPSADIRLTNEITQGLRAKLVDLGLDPTDTTGPELYSALQQRLAEDDQAVRKALGMATDASADQIVAAVQQFLDSHHMPRTCFALKASVAKRLLKKKLPKLAMKQLGYRSGDSMLKHEAVAAIYAAASVAEPASWQRTFREQYTALQPSDFETRPIALVQPATKKWQKLAAQHVANAKHNILSFPELGTIVLLPMAEPPVDGLAITTLLLVMEEMNRLRAHSSYAKLQQVKPQFGSIMQRTALSEPLTSATLAGQAVPWRMIQRYYAYSPQAYHPDIFEPHVQPEDLQWYSGETALASLGHRLSFWLDTQCLGLLHEGEIVSCNVLDVALSYCNHLSFPDRIVHFVRDNLWHELMMRYLHQENLEAAVHQQLSAELAEADVPELADELEAKAV